jgi:hypothetical protein
VTDDEVRRTALHESGHAVAAYLCGFACPGPVTIEAARSFSGACFPGHPPPPTAADLATRSRPVPLQAARLRASRELPIIVWLAGSVAEDMFFWRGRTGRLPETAAGRIVAALPRREAAMLAAAAAADAVGSDAEVVAGLLGATHVNPGGATARAYVRWLEAECRELLGTPPGLVMLRALSLALMERRTLSAREWREVLAGAGG